MLTEPNGQMYTFLWNSTKLLLANKSSVGEYNYNRIMGMQMKVKHMQYKYNIHVCIATWADEE